MSSRGSCSREVHFLGEAASGASHVQQTNLARRTPPAVLRSLGSGEAHILGQQPPALPPRQQGRSIWPPFVHAGTVLDLPPGGGDPLYRLVTSPGDLQFSQIAAGMYSTCGVLAANATAVCWGEQLPMKAELSASCPLPPPLASVTACSSAGLHPCHHPCHHPCLHPYCRCVGSDSLLLCSWQSLVRLDLHPFLLPILSAGDNTHGMLGDGGATDFGGPVPVAGSNSYQAVAVGTDHACGLLRNTTALCWGDPTWAFQFLGSPPDPTVPSAVLGGHRFSQITVGRLHTCGLAPWEPAGRKALCWGELGRAP